MVGGVTGGFGHGLEESRAGGSEQMGYGIRSQLAGVMLEIAKNAQDAFGRGAMENAG